MQLLKERHFLDKIKIIYVFVAIYKMKANVRAFFVKFSRNLYKYYVKEVCGTLSSVLALDNIVYKYLINLNCILLLPTEGAQKSCVNFDSWQS